MDADYPIDAAWHQLELEEELAASEPARQEFHEWLDLTHTTGQDTTCHAPAK